MVVTITLNPLVENRLTFDNIKNGSVNRASEESFRAGGKGINVSRQLNFLGIKNTAVTFVGGDTGKIFRRILKDENIDFSPVQSKEETRRATVVTDISKGEVTSYIPANPAITKAEAADLEDKASKVINNASVVVFAGSSPSPECDNIFPALIEKANNEDKVTVLDTYGKHLQACIDASPSIIHLNRDEVKASLNIELNTEDDYREFLSGLYKKGIRLAFITDGNKTFYASKFDFHYKITVPEIEETDPVGSGDAFVSGIVYGLEKAFVFDQFTETAVKLGALNAASGKTCAVTLSELENYSGNVTVEAVGKKMKILDDSPTI